MSTSKSAPNVLTPKRNPVVVKLRRDPLAYEALNIIMLEFVKDFLDFWVHRINVYGWNQSGGATVFIFDLASTKRV